LLFEGKEKSIMKLHPEMKYNVEPGVFKVWVAWNSAEGLESSFEVVKK
jgi:hypothetical protein